MTPIRGIEIRTIHSRFQSSICCVHRDRLGHSERHAMANMTEGALRRQSASRRESRVYYERVLSIHFPPSPSWSKVGFRTVSGPPPRSRALRARTGSAGGVLVSRRVRSGTTGKCYHVTVDEQFITRNGKGRTTKSRPCSIWTHGQMIDDSCDARSRFRCDADCPSFGIGFRDTP